MRVFADVVWILVALPLLQIVQDHDVPLKAAAAAAVWQQEQQREPVVKSKGPGSSCCRVLE